MENIYSIIPALIFFMFLQILIRFSAEIFSILSNTKSYIFLTTLVDNEGVYHLAICGLDVTVSWGRSSVIICKLLHNLSPSPLLTICHRAPARGERQQTLAFTLTFCMSCENKISQKCANIEAWMAQISHWLRRRSLH